MDKNTTGTTYSIVLDYLAGVVSADLPPLLTALEEFYGGRRQRCRGKNGYTVGHEIEVGDAPVCEVHFREGENPWVVASGSRAQALQTFLRGSGMGWYVTRMDAALDVYDASYFVLLVDQAKQWAKDKTMVTQVAGDWIGKDRGRTFYLGSRSSRCFHRIYEKGRKERTDHNWIRCELEYKPQSKEERFAATVVTAPQLWAMHAGPIFGQCLGVDLAEVFAMAPSDCRPKRDYERSCRALASQYGNTVEKWLRDCDGDPVAFVAELLVAVQHQRSVRRWEAAPCSLSTELEITQ